jgi:hypothetical protein
MSDFVFYAEPSVVIGEPQSTRLLIAGLGEDDHDGELTLIAVTDANGTAEIRLEPAELKDLIINLGIHLASIGDDA